MIYLAGIHVSCAQSIEVLVSALTILTFTTIASRQQKMLAKSQKEGGEIMASPTTLMGRLVTPLHAIPTVATPLSYLAGVFSNKMQQPEWYTRSALDIPINAEMKGWTWIAAALGLVATIWWYKAIVKALGKQFHFIAPRKNGEVVSSGPFSVIRHPIYAMALAQLGLLSVAYWSWLPLISMAVCASAFVYKISVEEHLIEQTESMGPAYLQYKKSVPYRIVPYIW
ncbi:hypothetical protein BDP27DRAFT_1343345 [Rhodocollybia butyracea]|uniref:Protein-S-isoprenylcysteine O-methyltransferase n=1 Tax=Rhodocollybia butyracea TaxID=206335 RepID=A0A9P5P7U3_9AGAR|nr:hypothetical protein BDP27DRAFT_1343345 [Rhodocollybia butyracea]